MEHSSLAIVSRSLQIPADTAFIVASLNSLLCRSYIYPWWCLLSLILNET